MRHLLSILLFSISIYLSGQNTLYLNDFIRYSVKDGLIDNEVHYLAQDTMGYIWVGTENGISRFDGYNFTSFTQDADPHLLSGNYIEKLILSNGKLAVMAREGFSIIEPKYLQSLQYDFNPVLKTELKNAVYDMLQLKDGRIIISYAAGIALLDKEGKIIQNYSFFTNRDVGKKRIYFAQEIFSKNDDEILIYVQDTKLYQLNLKNKILKRIDQEPNPDIQKYLPWNEALSLENRISEHELLIFCFPLQSYKYINTKTGVYKKGKLPYSIKFEFYWNSFVSPMGNNSYAINAENTGFYTFQLNPVSGEVVFNQEKNLPEIRCYHVLKDNNNKLWVATNKGVLMARDNPSPFIVKALQPSENQTNNHFISSLLSMGDTICIGMVNGKTAAILFDKRNNRIIKTIVLKNRSQNRISAIQRIDAENILLSSYDGNFIYNLKSNRILKIFKDLPSDVISTDSNDDFIYLSSITTGRLYRMEKKSKFIYIYPDSLSQFLKYTSQLYADHNNNLWLAGYDLHRLDQNGKLHKNLMAYNHKSEGRILCISGNKNKTLSMGTSSGKIIQYNIDNGTFTSERYDMKYKLPVTSISPIVRGIQVFNAGDKFYSFNINTRRATEISLSPEYPEEKIMTKSFLFESDSTAVTTATMNNLVTVSLQPSIQTTKPAFISMISYNDTPLLYHPSNQIKLDYNQQLISFHISDLNYSSSPVLLEYKLDQGSWHKLQDQVAFNGLAYATHQLYLRTTPLFGESAVNKYTIKLTPPFYKAFWFLSLIAMAFISLVIFEIRRRLKANQEFSRLNQLLSESEIKALHAQMNPHFIFNSLNSIKSLILHHKNDEASRYLSTFSSLIRQNLNHHRQAFITIEEQFEYIKKYLEMEKLRCPNLDYAIIPENRYEFFDEYIPPMIIQPIVENAIWHGQNPEIDVHKIIISILKNGKRAIIKVEDFGKGINNKNEHEVSKGNAIALQNIKQRIELYNQKYKIQGTLEICDKKTIASGSGTIVTFSFLQNSDL